MADMLIGNKHSSFKSLTNNTNYPFSHSLHITLFIKHNLLLSLLYQCIHNYCTKALLNVIKYFKNTPVFLGQVIWCDYFCYTNVNTQLFPLYHLSLITQWRLSWFVNQFFLPSFSVSSSLSNIAVFLKLWSMDHLSSSRSVLMVIQKRTVLTLKSGPHFEKVWETLQYSLYTSLYISLYEFWTSC